MKFTCEKAVLNEAISICIHAVSHKKYHRCIGRFAHYSR